MQYNFLCNLPAAVKWYCFTKHFLTDQRTCHLVTPIYPLKLHLQGVFWASHDKHFFTYTFGQTTLKIHIVLPWYMQYLKPNQMCYSKYIRKVFVTQESNYNSQSYYVFTISWKVVILWFCGYRTVLSMYIHVPILNLPKCMSTREQEN